MLIELLKCIPKSSFCIKVLNISLINYGLNAKDVKDPFMMMLFVKIEIALFIIKELKHKVIWWGLKKLLIDFKIGEMVFLFFFCGLFFNNWIYVFINAAFFLFLFFLWVYSFIFLFFSVIDFIKIYFNYRLILVCVCVFFFLYSI